MQSRGAARTGQGRAGRAARAVLVAMTWAGAAGCGGGPLAPQVDPAAGPGAGSSATVTSRAEGAVRGDDTPGAIAPALPPGLTLGEALAQAADIPPVVVARADAAGWRGDVATLPAGIVRLDVLAGGVPAAAGATAAGAAPLLVEVPMGEQGGGSRVRRGAVRVPGSPEGMWSYFVVVDPARPATWRFEER